MKKSTKILSSILCAVCCIALVFSSAPVSNAAGLMRFVIDDKTYTKVYNDMGVLELVHWNYDASEDVLKLKNFGTSEKPQTPIFAYPYSGSMTIELIGDNYIQATHDMAMIFIGNITFTGTGSLTIICNDSYAIFSDYVVSIKEGVTLNISGLAGITAGKGLNIDTTGSVNIHSIGKSVFTYSDVRITKGTVSLSGTNGIYSSAGNVYLSGGQTDVLINSTQKAIYLLGEENYVEWSANGTVRAGATSSAGIISSYNGEKYFRATFSGIPRLNYPRKIYWDDTVIDDDGTTNPVGRWSAVENATGYTVKLYYKSGTAYTLIKTFTVTDALSCNFGGHFTEYGDYYFSVSAIGTPSDAEKPFLNSFESPKSAESYYFSGEVETRYYITFPESEYFTFIPESGKTFARYGESYSFNVEIDPAYTQSEIKIWANGARVILRKGKYTIDSVTENIIITINELDINRYTVTMPEHEAYTIYLLPDNSTDVTYGQSCSFSVELSDIYMQSNIVVTANGKTLTPKYGIIYTISNITENYTVEITGLIRDSYDVTYKHLDGTYITTQTVDHGYTTTAASAPSIGDGLEFVEWCLEDGTAFDFSAPITDAITLYARYEAPKENGYYLISSLEQLIWFRDEVNFGNTAINAKLMADIEMNSGKYIIFNGEPVFTDDAVIWEPIGGYDYEDEDNYVKFFNGKFDGNGHTLAGFYIKHDKMSADASSLGIFGIVSEQGSVNNLNVSLSYFDGYGDIGSIAGVSYSPITNCTSTAVLVGVEDVGGIVGESYADISNCVFAGSITVEQYKSSSTAAGIGGSNAGGIVGKMCEGSSRITDCSVNGKISAYKNAGGLVGTSEVDNTLTQNCTSDAVVNATQNAAGILAYAPNLNVSFVDCTNNSDVTAALNAGGYFADCYATILSGVNYGLIEAEQNAGGFGAVGSLNIEKSINKGSVTATSGMAAAFIAAGDIGARFCYNIADISGGTAASGFAASGENAVINQCHNYAAVTATAVDAFAFDFTNITITSAYYCSDFMSSVNGAPADKEWFSCGYVALLLNRNNDNNFWAQEKLYPVFSSDSLQGYVLPFGGEGSAVSPYIISTENELRLARILVNVEKNWASKSYKLGADIHVSNPETANNFAPFGSMSNVFAGSFDGDGHTISGINLYSTGNDVALFPGLSGTIKNLNIDNFTVTGNVNVAAISSQSDGVITNCTVRNSIVNGYRNVGGIVGYNFGKISFCNNYASVKGTLMVGGVVGLHEDDTVESCFNYGNITGVDSNNEKSTEVGGVVGKNFADVLYCGNIGTVSADSFAGGVVAVNYHKMLGLYNGGTVTANEEVGAITSLNESEVEVVRCFYISGTATNGLDVGTPQTADQAYNGTTAYSLNDFGYDKRWAQDGNHPYVALPDGSDAVVHTVTFYGFDSAYYYLAATKHGGTAVTPPAPVVEGYNFLYWNVPYDNVTENMSTTAVFDRDNLITFTPTATVEYFSAEYINVFCGFDPEAGVTVADLDSQISNASPVVYMNFYEDEEYSAEDRLFTGMSVSLYPKEGFKADCYYVVIFGDVTGDGYVDEKDAFIINMICNEVIYLDELDFAQQLAADVNRDGVVDNLDFEYIQQNLLKQNNINQSASTD